MKQYIVFNDSDWRLMDRRKPKLSDAPIIIMPSEADKGRVYTSDEIEVEYQRYTNDGWSRCSFAAYEMCSAHQHHRIVGTLKPKQEDETPDWQGLLEASKEAVEKGYYWKQRCLAAEQVIDHVHESHAAFATLPGLNKYKKLYNNWQELKNKQP